MTFIKSDFKRFFIVVFHFTGGFFFGEAYYVCLIKNIPIADNIRLIGSLLLSTVLGVGTVVSIQMRCISLLTLLMYCGKPGRGVLKAVVLTYVVRGPITNMGLNAKEVVRVFGCSSELAYNISKEKHFLVFEPIRKTIGSLQYENYRITETLKYFDNVVPLLEREIEDVGDNQQFIEDDDYEIYESPYHKLDNKNISNERHVQKNGTFIKTYLNKLKQRCQNQLYYSQMICDEAFSSAYVNCYKAMPNSVAWILCWPVKLPHVCVSVNPIDNFNICNYDNQIDPGLGEGYVTLKRIKMILADKCETITLRTYTKNYNALYNIQNARETSGRIKHAFEEKMTLMRSAITVMDVCIALLFLRIVNAAVVYHDMYLTNIDYDNVYITGYFKQLDIRRQRKNKVILLPLKKMERNKYVDIHSLAYTTKSSKLFIQILKVSLEMITATTFVMLDRLFYEALDVVRQHAEIENKQGLHGLDIEVEGTGILASFIRKLLHNLNNRSTGQMTFSNEHCIPRPRLMPYIYFVKIYGGYLWILLLLCINPYTFRLRRLVCSQFYPRREKQRILHLYNDILKRRMKLQKTLRRKAVQSVRAHYLSGENILTLRMKFPNLLGWLRVFPVARMTCLICGETEPGKENSVHNIWRSCTNPSCPFIYCVECWVEIGKRCLACDPSLVELSDIDSLSEDELPKN